MKGLKAFLEKIRTDRKMLIMLALGAVGVLLIAVSEFSADKTEENAADPQTTPFYNYEDDIEKKLDEIISQINGVGRVKVMVTLKSGEENKYAYNESYQSKNGENSEDRQSENEYVVIDGERGDECVLLSTEFPRIQGVMVVCDGGGSSAVKNDITNAVSSLLDISANSISVLEMKKSEE